MADEAQLRALLLRGLAGDDAAHRAFLTEAAALLRAYFRNRLRGRTEDAEDLVQETLVALHTRRDSYDPHYPLTAWLYAIARYRLIDFLRRAKRRAHASLDGVDVGEIDPDYAASATPGAMWRCCWTSCRRSSARPSAWSSSKRRACARRPTPPGFRSPTSRFPSIAA